MGEKYEVITYKDIVAFNYMLPGEDKQDQISREVTLVWDDTLENFFEVSKREKPYKVTSFEKEKAKEWFITSIENETDKIIEEVEEEISQKMKFGFNYTSPTYED